MKNLSTSLLLLVPILLVFTFIFGYKNLDEKDVIIPKIDKVTKNSDHSTFAILQIPFASPQEMTAACLTCHNKRAGEVMETAHWTCTTPDTLKNGTIVFVGKKNVINNFCVGVKSNEALCGTCHAGYGCNVKDFDFSDPNNVDCIVCHDNTGKYVKEKGKSGMVSPDVDLNFVAQHVGPTNSKNCSNCHAKGGGGNNVKHGDLDMDMTNPEKCTKQVDVHMTKDGPELNCSQCHISSHHEVKGTGPMTNSSTLSKAANRVTCTECHTERPHTNPMLNDHYKKIACQTCHIPVYAKLNKTKTFWDWSTAGKTRNGEYYEESNEDHTLVFDSKHGTSVYGTNLRPEYRWWNGIAGTTTLDTKINPADTVDMNPLAGDYKDHNSRIYPFKIMRGNIPYDTEYHTFIQFKSFGPKGSGALWSDFNWAKAARAGMDYAGQPYSGQIGFVSTRSYWPVNHMVSPASEALTCSNCHSRNGVLANLEGFYLPGRDVNAGLDWAGKLFVLFAAIGVVTHSLLRFRAFKNHS
ncbi:MAG: tetrathionate reductase family octaheme c-type cytochrome [Bacteroidota bacterium]